MKRTWIGKALVTGASGLTLLMAGAVAEASVTITISQQGDTVLATGSGTLDTHDLAYYSTFAGDAPGVAPEYAVIALGPLDISSDYYDGGVSGPLSFGGGDAVSASTGSGDFFEVAGGQEILTPAGYVSGAGLSGSATFSDTTIASLGLTPGTYVYAWGAGDHADSLTVRIDGAPEPATWALIALGFAGLGVLGRRTRRAALAV